MYESIYDQLITKEAARPFSLPAWIALAPFEEYLGMRIKEAANGSAVLDMPFRAAHCQGMGLMHGGAVTALADTAMAIAIKTTLPEGTHFATIEMTLSFQAPITWGIVTALAQVTEKCDRDITGKVDIVTEDGITAANFRAVFRIRRKTSGPVSDPGKQSLT